MQATVTFHLVQDNNMYKLTYNFPQTIFLERASGIKKGIS